MDLTSAAARKLAGKSSRRQFFKFLGVGSLGTGLFLTGTKVSLGAIQGCVGCGGGPCNPCGSPVQQCEVVTGGQYVCKTCQQGGGCPDGCMTSGEWFCCLTSGRVGCRFRCSECNCPAGSCANPSCRCFTNMAVPCTPRLHSGDQPCVCPPVEAPIPSLAS
jgi:hypothetical protein